MNDSVAGAGNVQDVPEHLIIPESKEVLKQIKNQKPHNDRSMSKRTRSPGVNGKISQWLKMEQFKQQNK